jgi:hypothetical protein
MSSVLALDGLVCMTAGEFSHFVIEAVSVDNWGL